MGFKKPRSRHAFLLNEHWDGFKKGDDDASLSSEESFRQYCDHVLSSLARLDRNGTLTVYETEDKTK